MRLEVLDYAGLGSWRWRLIDADGGFVADHQVDVDESAWQFAAFTDLYRWLRWNLPPEPDRRAQREGELLVEIGQWVTDWLLGPVAAALTRARGKDAVRLELPAEAAAVGLWPWELARVNDRTLVGHRVRLVVCPLPHAEVFKAPVGDRLRMLAVFSLPEGAGAALNLRKERYALSRLVEQIAKVNRKAVELKVVQYGATRQALEEVLLEGPGWDVVHLSGHGQAGGLVLETDTGAHDLIDTDELVDLLDYTGDQLKLVTLSACESGAATAEQHLNRLGLGPELAPATRTDTDGPASAELSGLAGAVAERLDAAVLAMRYPVVDEFAIDLAGRFYDLVLGKGQPVSRALALSLSQASAKSSAGVPGVSVGVPTLVGERAAALTVAPPAGAPAELDDSTKLAGFPDQPERLVGRGGPLTRAAAALAPHSGHSGILFHGMAGAGKTTCAVELAYTHQDSFTFLAWYQAPPEGHDITTTLSDFAWALESQVGLPMVDRVTTLERLRQALPGLTEVLERNRILVVVDNAESLLTDTGEWRDERWGLLVQAMTAHQGLSRLVLTSRRRPANLEAGVVVEAVHALSIQESVLLARDLPHLGPLLADTAASGLVSRVLTLVQGHPKLLELADGQAGDPTALEERLARADTSWQQRGIALEPFLTDGETPASEQDFLAVLQGWTRDTTTALPEPCAVFLRLVSCLEPDDRIAPVIQGNWADVWWRLELPGDPPPLEAGLWTPLAQRALVSIGHGEDGPPQYLRVHPGVAETVREQAGQAFRDAVDTEAANYWLYVLNEARRREQNEGAGWLVRRAALSAAPYLLRQHGWNDLGLAAETALSRDLTKTTAAVLLPLLTVARNATRGTDDENAVGRTYARALMVLDPNAADPELDQLLTQADNQQEFGNASAIAGDLATIYHDLGRLEDALIILDRKADYTRRAGRGPWTQLGDEARRLQILRQQGNSEQVLERIEQLRDTMATLPDPPEANDSSVTLWNVREVVLETGMLAARDLKRWEQALALNAEKLTSLRNRDASDHEVAFSRYNDYGPLLFLGRTQEAIALLRECYAVFEAANDLSGLGNVLSALAHAEDALGYPDRASDLAIGSLHMHYAAGQVDVIAASHWNVARYAERSGGDAATAWAHRMASAMIEYQIGDGGLTQSLRTLAGMLPAGGPDRPVMFAEVCQLVEQTDGVHLAELLDRLPTRAPDGQAALDAVLELAEQAAEDQAEQRQQKAVKAWVPIISALWATRAAEAESAAAALALLEELWATLGEQPKLRVLVGVLRRMQAGERDPGLLQTDGLDEIDTAIATRALAVLTGEADVDTEAWHTLTTRSDEDDQVDDGRQALVAAVVATVRGDSEAGVQVEAALPGWDADPEMAGFAQALRRVLAGERDPAALTTGLDPDATEMIGTVLQALRAADTDTGSGTTSEPGSAGPGGEA